VNTMKEWNAGDQQRLIEKLEEMLKAARSVHLPYPRAPDSEMVRLARLIFKARRRRDEALDGLGLDFGEPAWDLLLDLFISYHEGRQISVSSACLAASVPPTTALRWIGHLGDVDLLVREPDPADRRRCHIRLTPRGIEAMEHYLSREVAVRANS
jgi:DNA-binding MarR family transcriptional regulator